MIYWALGVSGAFIAASTIYLLLLRERKKNKYSPFTEPSLRSPGYTLGQDIDSQTDKLLFPLLVASLSPFIYFTLSNGFGYVEQIDFSGSIHCSNNMGNT
jgi:hypothetical protein